MDESLVYQVLATSAPLSLREFRTDTHCDCALPSFVEWCYAYLRGYPQVQVWDPDNPREIGNGAPKGSGALWNNNADNPGKWPLVKADNPVGEWNTFHIRMVGPRVWVWLHDKLTVDGQVLDNFFDPSQPVVVRGPIELQTHGSEIRFRNIFIRVLPDGAKQARMVNGFFRVFSHLGVALPIK